MTATLSRPLPIWDADVDDVFVCTAIRTVAPGTATVVLAARTPGIVTFRAGQYVTIGFGVDGREVSRCYTIASPPTRPERLAITVKRTPGGELSPWLHDGGLQVGSTVRLGPPQGEFTLEHHPASSYLFLTAGSGITPALAVLREADDLGTDLDVVLVHSQRQPGEVPYRAELEAICAGLPRARVRFVCSGVERSEESVESGRLTADLLARLVPDVAGREVFVCGPDGYRAAAREAALGVGAQAARIHEESFRFAAPSPPPAVDAGIAGHAIEFRDLGVVVRCPPGTTVLDAALAAGVVLPFSCGQGLCGTCKRTVIDGAVDMNHAGGIRPREIAAGKFLPCCSTPTGDLVIGA